MIVRKTKIVCSMGPTTADDEIVRSLILAGMNVARFNFSHGSHAEQKIAMDRVKRVSKEINVPVALLLDTKGPEIRTGMVENDGKVTINTGDEVIVSTDGAFTVAANPQTKTSAHISLSWKDISSRIKELSAEGKAQNEVRILIADGLLELVVEDTDGVTVRCRAANTASLGSKKNVNLIGLHAGLPIMVEQDKADIAFGVEQDVDFIAASFLSFPHEVTEIRSYLQSLGSKAKIIAKIENEEGIDNIEEIARFSDGVMVARGDLGVQLPMERIPIAQKHIIEVCRREGKPVITATQMLDSMIVNPRPTRAELTDVSNAIFDGTDAVMLSGETANGAYPVEAVTLMAKIALTVEQSAEYRKHMRELQFFADAGGFYEKEIKKCADSSDDLGLTMARVAYLTAIAVQAKAIVTPTLSGNSARIISTFHPEQPILAVTPDEHSVRYMQLLRGVVPRITELADDTDTMIQNATKTALDSGFAAISEKIVMAASIPLRSPVMLNSIRVLIVGNILARGNAGGYASAGITKAHGRIIHAVSPSDARALLKVYGGEILVCSTLTEEYTPIIRIVNGIICEGVSKISESMLREINPRLVWITRVQRASRDLESGLSVTIDGNERLVYEGTV